MAGPSTDGVTSNHIEASTGQVPVGHPVGDHDPYGMGYADYVSFMPSTTDIHSKLDMVAFHAAFRPLCCCCDEGFLKPLLKKPLDVPCVSASLYLPNNCPTGTACKTKDRTTPGWKKCVASCLCVPMSEVDHQKYKLTTVYVPLKLDKYLMEYMLIKMGRKGFGMCPTTASTLRELEYSEPKLKGAFTAEGLVVYERALLTWYPTFLMAESLCNIAVKDAEDPLSMMPNFLMLRSAVQGVRNFFIGEAIVTGATHWSPDGIDIPDLDKTEEEDPEDPEENADGPVLPTAQDEQDMKDNKAYADVVEKIIKDQSAISAQYEAALEREEQGGVAAIPPLPAGNPENFATFDVRQMKDPPKDGENRSGHVFFLSREERIMRDLVREAEKMEENPRWVQAVIDEYNDPNRVPAYEALQRREQYYEKIEKAEGSESKCAVLIGPQAVEANVGSTRASTIVDSMNARVLKPNARVIKAHEKELTLAYKVTLEHFNRFLPVNKIRELWITHGGFEDGAYVPGAWTEKKYDDEKNAWREKTKLKHMEMFVKFANMMKGKTQRLISNEGGMRQVSRNFIAKLCEELEGKAMHEHNTKHKTKEQVNALLFRNTNKKWQCGKPGVIVEGDGSAWDSSCGKAVRWCIEQTAEKYVLDALGPLLHGLGPEAMQHCWERSTQEQNMKWSYKEHSGIFDRVFMLITDFTMRSTGDSMTSFLNRLVNLVLWTCALTTDPHVVKQYNKPVVYYHCRWTPKTNRRPLSRCMFFIYEGDDSGLKLEAELMKYKKEIEQYWSDWGFNMKLKFIWTSDPEAPNLDGCDVDTAEFCGWKYFIHEGCFTKVCMPDASRALENAMSTSQCANQSRNGRDCVAEAAARANAERFENSIAGLSATYQARSEVYRAMKKKQANFDTKLTNELAFMAKGARTDDSLDGEYLNAMNTSWQYTHKRMAKILQESSGATDWDRRMWDGGVATTHETHPIEAAALGQRISRPRWLPRWPGK